MMTKNSKEALENCQGHPLGGGVTPPYILSVGPKILSYWQRQS